MEVLDSGCDREDYISDLTARGLREDRMKDRDRLDRSSHICEYCSLFTLQEIGNSFFRFKTSISIMPTSERLEH
jgi:hypothetical protein